MSLIALGVLIVLLFCVGIAFSLIFNRFKVLQNGAEAGLSQIMVVLKKRFDMILQLVDAIRSYAHFEKEVMENIATLRTLLNETKTPKSVDVIEQNSQQLLKSIFAVVENYPDLKTSQVVTKLMNAITDVEDEIARQRYTYNNIVQDYNTRCETIPSTIVASLFSFQKLDYLTFEETMSKTPNTKWKS